ncbi:MAG: hypothetical protein ACT6TH_15095 [Brevundimonas sp.]|uniref:hypothetical protein n=1 Tax=Brevundimonas sp. TaxID=1871086 RepID=UPI004033CA07
MTDNLRIWSQVDKTDPAHTKKVTQRGGFTAISAAYQIMRATEVFGPVGEGWGYTAGEPIFHDALVMVPVTLWHGDRANVFGPMFGGAEWKDKNGRLDSDAAKKATTDALTKLLSQLGFNADVFLGRFDDSKYVADMEREFAPSSPAADFAIATMRTCRTADEFKGFWAKNKDALKQQLTDAEYRRVLVAKDEEVARIQQASAQTETPFDQKEAA